MLADPPVGEDYCAPPKILLPICRPSEVGAFAFGHWATLEVLIEMASMHFRSALAFVWRPENDGQAYHVTNHDTGLGTAWGVTEATWEDAIAAGFATGLLKDASQQAIGYVLERMYWDRCRCDDLGPGVGLMVFNMAMLSGVYEAAVILQRVVGSDEDGRIGDVTVAATVKSPALGVLDLLTTRDELFFHGLTSFAWFGAGWDARVTRCLAASIGELPMSQPVQITPAAMSTSSSSSSDDLNAAELSRIKEG